MKKALVNEYPQGTVENIVLHAGWKRTEVICKALAIGEKIMNAVTKISKGSMQDVPILSMLPWFKLQNDLKAGRDVDFDRLIPKCYEVLVFGSTARGEKDEVGDLDLIVLDNGFFSDYFTKDKRGTGNNMYGELEGNVNVFFEGFLGIPESVLTNIYGNLKIDLHVLPIDVVTSPDVRAQLAKKHKDPVFFKNAFSSLLRYEHRAYRLEPITIEMLEKKYEQRVHLKDKEN